jgi:hypothetical protein
MNIKRLMTRRLLSSPFQNPKAGRPIHPPMLKILLAEGRENLIPQPPSPKSTPKQFGRGGSFVLNSLDPKV